MKTVTLNHIVRITLRALLGMLLPGMALAAVLPTQLRCEYLVNPLGIDAEKPRLSWTIDEVDSKIQDAAQERGLIQAGYQILVASTADGLKQDKGDLWDSGKVLSGSTSQIEYAGSALTSRQRCFWKVRCYIADGKVSPWSAPGFWEMGLLKPDDWKAQWIDAAGYKFPPGKTKVPARAPLKILSATYGLDGAWKDVKAVIEGKVLDNTLAIQIENHGLGGDPALGKPKKLIMEYQLGSQRLKKEVDEHGVLAIPEGTRVAASTGESVPYLRKSVKLAGKPVAKARLYVTALGLYEMYLNGQRVGDIIFAPEWTDYRKRIRYQVYDVTSMLKPGDNVLAGLVGTGWYSGHIGWEPGKYYGKVPGLLAQLEVTYADGAFEQVVSDDSWKGAASPILASDFMKGEDYDARRELKGWNLAGFDDSSWEKTTVRAETARPLESQVTHPVRKICELKAKTLAEPKPGRWTFDLGQNMVGFARLRISASVGTVVTLRHAEMLNSDGTIYTTNLRTASAVDTYICAGAGVEIYQPRFTFHGFRYVEVTGLTKKPSLDAITGIVIASDTPRTGEFACSDERINQLYSNIVWGQRGNYLSLPTDCPQRDERLGWMGDAQVFIRTASYNSDIAAFFTKWLVDVDDARKDGAFTDVSPFVTCSQGTPAWADAGVICPWTIYQVYGDTRQLEAHYPAMVQWVEWCRVHSTGLIRDKDRGNDYGDWLSIGADTPKDLIGTAYFAYSTRLVAQAAKALGKADDAAKYDQLFQEIKAAYNKKYVAADGRIHGNTQSSYLMALKFGLLSDEMRAKATQYLVDDITGKKDHLSTGFVGVSYLLPVLTQAGRIDTAFKLFLQDSFPSWLFSVKHGATTIWERWDGWTPEKGFQDPGMNSFNHYSLGSCGEWMFASLAGIDTDGPAFRKLMIRPTTGNGISWVKASYDSIHGKIITAWKNDDKQFSLEVSIPPNSTATVCVPAKDAAAVTESGNPANKADGVKFLQMKNGAALYEVGSGRYKFASRK